MYIEWTHENHLNETISVNTIDIRVHDKMRQFPQNILKYFFPSAIANVSLTHCSLETPKRIIGKQCRLGSDATKHSV